MAWSLGTLDFLRLAIFNADRSHMGVLFGIPNQIVLVLLVACIIILVISGYMSWWHRRPGNALGAVPKQVSFSPGMPQGSGFL